MRFNYGHVDWASARQRRRELLAETDVPRTWEWISDAQRAEIAAYREVLKAITDIHTDPADIVWPTKPTWF